MIELTKHIESLLLENDCVIVPGLGGFISHQMPARYSKEENLFLPPERSVGFNPNLKINDGLLVQSYMSLYDTNFSDASQMVEAEVEELLEELHENGKVELPNIGELTYSIYDSYNFTPFENRLAAPCLYGLDLFEMKTWVETEAEIAVSTNQTEKAPALRKRRFILRPSAIANAVAMIAVLFICFSISTPIENTEIVGNGKAQLLPGELIHSMERNALTVNPVQLKDEGKPSVQPRRITAKEVKVDKKADKQERLLQRKTVVINKLPQSMPEQVKHNAKARTENKAAVSKADVQQPQVAKNNASKRYHIIVSSVPTAEDAQKIASQLKSKGYSGAAPVIGDGKNRVSISSYVSEKDAYEELNRLNKDKAYQNAWILKK